MPSAGYGHAMISMTHEMRVIIPSGHYLSYYYEALSNKLVGVASLDLALKMLLDRTMARVARTNINMHAET